MHQPGKLPRQFSFHPLLPLFSCKQPQNLTQQCWYQQTQALGNKPASYGKKLATIWEINNFCCQQSKMCVQKDLCPPVQKRCLRGRKLFSSTRFHCSMNQRRDMYGLKDNGRSPFSDSTSLHYMWYNIKNLLLQLRKNQNICKLKFLWLVQK